MTAVGRIRGSFFGALAGDCIGSIYEDAGFKRSLFSDETSANRYASELIQLIKDFPKSVVNSPLRYSDDTAMARCVAESLINVDNFDHLHMSKLLSESYFADPDRGYGKSIPKVFHLWKENNYSDILGPAKIQFGGLGSRGNGAAIRVFPVALFYRDLENVMQMAKFQAQLTHTNPDAILGAILQAVAVHFALHSDTGSFNVDDFIAHLLQVLDSHCSDLCGSDEIDRYKEAINQFEILLRDDASSFTVANKLGTGVKALRSVPASIFAFLKSACSPEQGDFTMLQSGTARTVAYAISLGGDTDSIGSMAGAIAGAFYGDHLIPKDWAPALEGYEDYEKFAAAIWAKNFGDVLPENSCIPLF